MKQKRDNNILSTFSVKSPTFSDYLTKIKEYSIKSREIILWFRNKDEFETDSYFWCNDTMAYKLGLNRNEQGLISTKEYYSTFVLDTEGQEFVDNLKAVSARIKSDTTIKKENYIVKAKNVETNEIYYLDFILEVFERYPSGEVKAWGGNGVDVSEAYKRQKEIEYLANHDVSTGLYNRYFVEEYIKKNKLPSNYGVIVFDVDGLKITNDAFGHLEGDKIIKHISDSLSVEFSHDSLVARIGGDEFLVISPFTNTSEFDLRISGVSSRINETNKEHIIDVGVSYGYHAVIDNNMTYEEAFKLAESVMYSRKLRNSTSKKNASLETILTILNERPMTGKCVKSIADNAVAVLKQLGHNRRSDEEEIRLLSRVYDIGNIALPESVVSKSSDLTDVEYKVVKKHTETGYKLMKAIFDKEKVSLGVLHHHERWDGLGYPFGLSKDEIPLYSRIIAVCDAYEAMRCERPFRGPLEKPSIIDEITLCSGTQFDPKVVDAFKSII